MTVIPAQAGIQHDAQQRNKDSFARERALRWMPAFAGMTKTVAMC